MLNFVDTLCIVIFFPIVWGLFTGLLMIHIRLDAKKKWHKNEKMYPYFHYPFYKKIFLLGLNGAVNKLVVIATFIFNISIIILIIDGIWHLIAPNIITSNIFIADCVMYGISMFIKLGVYGLSPSRF